MTTQTPEFTEERKELERQEAEAIAKVRLHAEKQKARQKQLFDLTKVLTDAQDRLSRADSLKSYASQRMQELADAQLTIVGLERTTRDVDPASQLLDSYSSVAALKAFVLDYARLRAVLAQHVATARRDLDSFARANS